MQHVPTEASFWNLYVREALVENVNLLESIIVKLNGKIASIKRKHKHGKNILPKG